jgi:broad specificity phosphatase PhoE
MRSFARRLVVSIASRVGWMPPSGSERMVALRISRQPAAVTEAYACPMTDHTQSLLREALSLSEEERADLIVELLVSLEGPSAEDAATVEQAWGEELERRAHRALVGEAHGEEWSQVRDRVARALTDG